MNRSSRFGLSAFALAVGMIVGSSVNAQPASWSKIVEDARREGEVIVWAQASESSRKFWKDAFERDNPGIKVSLFQPGSSSERDTRALRELQAGVLRADIFISGGAGMVARLKPEKALRPIRPFLRDDVLDGKNWLGGEPAWVDIEKQYVLIGDLPAGLPGITHESVPEGTIKTWNDLLDPKFDGKIISVDPRQSGMAFAFGLFMNQAPGLGPDFVRKFYKGGRVAFTTDQRQISEWTDSGRMLIGMAVREPEILSLLSLGSKIRTLPPLIADDAPRSITVGSDSAASVPNIDPLPHPNATRVYLNWLYSREGQQAMVDATRLFSVRLDVDQSKLTERVKQQPGVRYINANYEGFSSAEQTKAMRDAVSAAIANK